MAKQVNEKVIAVRFFKTPAGNEPVRDWLKKDGIPSCVEDFSMNNQFIGSSFDDFLEEEMIGAEVEAGAIKKIIVCQLREVLKKNT